MRKSQRERLLDAKKKSGPQIVLNGLDDLLKLLVGGDLNPTQKAFIYDSTRLKAYKGPAGCAKTSTICAAGLARALLQPGSKGLVARYDYNDLMDTTALRLEEMLSRLPKGTLVDRDKSPPMKWWIQPIDPDGELSQITFMGLKDAIGSYEFNWAIIDEADEAEENRVHEVNTRLRNKGGDFSVMLAFNPPDKHHWLYTACTGRDFQDRNVKPSWLKLYEPQSKENVRNLPENYYDMLAQSLPEDMKQRLIEGEWGSTFDGQPVYREFKFNVHVKDRIEYNPDRGLLRFWDFGYHRPACIFAQFDWQGRLLILREVLGEREEASAFVRRIKMLTAQFFPNPSDIRDYGDPAVAQHKDTGKTLHELSKEGIVMHFRVSKIETGQTLIRQHLNLMIDGEPAMQFDRRGCHILIAAMRGGYRLDDKGEKAVKDGYYDHLCDALRYGCINTIGGGASHSSILRNMPTSLEYERGFDPF